MKDIKIGNQLWAAENLNSDTFLNGDLIEEITSEQAWYEFTEQHKPGWCYYDFNKENEKYGKIYNYFAIADERKLALAGYRIPSNSDWDELVEYIGEENAASLVHTSGWGHIDDENGNNESGFSALPGGYMDNGCFYLLKELAIWWSYEKYMDFKGNIIFTDEEPNPLYVRLDGEGHLMERGTNSEYAIICCGYYVRCLREA